MSGQLIAWALHQPDLRPAVRLTLAELASRANAGFECWPSVAAIAAPIRLSHRATQGALQELRGRRLIAISPRDRQSSVYRLLVPADMQHGQTAQATAFDWDAPIRGEGANPAPTPDMNADVDIPATMAQPRDDANAAPINADVDMTATAAQPCDDANPAGGANPAGMQTPQGVQQTTPTPPQDLRPESSNKESSKEEESLATLGTPRAHTRARARGVRIPDDWAPSPALRAFARGEGFTDQQTDRLADEFRDYWQARDGGGTKRDWDATFRNRVRAVADRAQRVIPLVRRVSAQDQAALDAIARMDARARQARQDRGADDGGPIIDGQYFREAV